MKKYFVAAAVAAAVLTGCSTESEVVSHNLSKDADNFKVDRRVVFFNGITDTYLLTIEGKCSITDHTGDADGGRNQLSVVCKVSEPEESGSYKKHFLGLSDNVSYFVEQVDGANVSAYHYKVIFRPETILPDIDMEISTNE